MNAQVRAYKKPGRPPCSVEGCTASIYCKQLCLAHYSRLRKRGAVGAAERERNTKGSGGLTDDGYRVIRAPGHPLATAQNKALEHRVVLYGLIGDGPHPCNWCGKTLVWRGAADRRINVDHLDWDRLNNAASNLVVSCLDCNTKRRAMAA